MPFIEQPEDDPHVVAAKTAILAGMGEALLVVRSWARAIITGDEPLAQIVAPEPDGDLARYWWSVAAAATSELAVLIGSLCDAQGIDADQNLAHLCEVLADALADDQGCM